MNAETARHLASDASAIPLVAVPFTRRLITLLTVLGLIALPAVAARAFCLGSSCEKTSIPTSRVPFCPLPDVIKKEVAAGYYAGRSPDVMTITKHPAFAG